MIDTLLGDVPPADQLIYYPVLRGKTSEWKALDLLAPGVRRRIVPIIEFIPDWRAPGSSAATVKRRAPQTPAQYVDRMLASTSAATPAGTRAFIYFGLAGPTARWLDIDLWSAFESEVSAPSHIIPLTALSSLERIPSLLRVVRTRGEVGLRLQLNDLGPSLKPRLVAALRALGIPERSVHIMVDLKNSPAGISHAGIRERLGDAHAFASVAVLAGVFPQDLTKYEPGVASEPRVEWETWWREQAATPGGERPLAFGDYTTQYAYYQPALRVPGSVSLRYTTDSAVVVFRGRQPNSGAGFGNEQMHGHCRLLVTREDYDGAAFSWGDHRMYCWADPTNGPGNAEQWRTAAIVHHITHVVVQLQDPEGSSATARAWARSRSPSACR